jgi:excinuclease ABC subunit A
MERFIELAGCRLHNLKDISVRFPLGKISVVCGPSGCGKSTLALDTLHGESKRRYLETLSPFAADLLGGRRVIPLESAENLPTSIAIGASHGEASTKSYALSLAECDAPLRALFAPLAMPACPVCGKPMVMTPREQIIREVAQMPLSSKIQFLAPIETKKQSLDKLSALFLSQGFTRGMADGETVSLGDLTEEQKKVRPKDFQIVVDRVILRENSRTRIAEAVDAALKLTHHKVIVLTEKGPVEYSTVPRCEDGDSGMEVPVLHERMFSPYSKEGACPQCKGTGINDESETCPHCEGLRLQKFLLNSGIVAREFVSWKRILETPFSALGKLLRDTFESRISKNKEPVLNSLLERIDAINQLGIGYLTPGRSGATLSGGEIQRLRLSSLSTGLLNGLLICLDEPASGLHTADVEKLWTVLKQIQKRGNTLVLIEHHPWVIKNADWVVEMGPGAGEKGGEILFQGPRDEVLDNPDSPTGQWIHALHHPGPRNKSGVDSAKDPDPKSHPTIQVKNFALYDMESISAQFPVQKFSVITGQSGSGKSTLLFQGIAKDAEKGNYQKLGIESLSVLSTGDFHGSRRSTVLSAIGLTAQLRDLFAKMPESKMRGYNASRFSTHTPGGRCENCKGEGYIWDNSGYEEAECPVCQGRRFRDEILEVRFKSLSIADILDLEVGAAYKLFANLKPFAEKLKPLVDTGLDYLRLGQITAHLSGGERSRLRLSIALSKAKAPRTLFLFDEPARGLHQKDMEHLLALIQDLCKAGHTVIAIEHAQDFIKAADYLLELKRAK